MFLLATDKSGERRYWEGRMWPDGSPVWTTHKHEAKHFSSARAAYECADTHKSLRNSEEWKAVPR